MYGSMADIQSAEAEIRRGKKQELEMWANAQPDGRPAKHSMVNIQSPTAEITRGKKRRKKKKKQHENIYCLPIT